MKTPLSALACGFALLLLSGITGCTRSSADTAKKEPAKPTTVKTVSVATQEIERTSVQPATVHPYHTAEIRAKVTGYVSEVHADIGSVVEKGSPLCQIDIPEMGKQQAVLKAQVAKHQAQESQAEAGVVLAKANVQVAEFQLVEAQSELSKVAASLAASEAEFKRTADLVERQSLQSRVLDEVRKRRDSEIAAKEAVTSAISSARAGVVVSQAQLKSAEADLAAAKAETSVAQFQLEEIDVMLSYTTLTAPFDGIVTQRSVDPGDLIHEGKAGSGTSPLFVVQQVSKVRVRIAVPETDAALVSQGDTVSLDFPFFSAEETVEGTITRVSGSLDPATRTMIVEVDMDNADGKLLPGMFGQATIHLSTKAAANTLPARAVRFDETGKAYVYIVDDQQTVEIVDVTTGFDDGHTIEIASGLTADQQVIDAHLRRFESGEKVTLLTD